MDRFFKFTRLFLGWDWFVGPALVHDGRRRTTQTLAMFTKLARGIALGNALVFLHTYLSIANAIGAFLPAEVAWAFGGDASGADLVMFIKAWVQAQLCIQSLAAIHRRLIRITEADH